MKLRWAKLSWMGIILLLASALSVSAQQVQRDYDSSNDQNLNRSDNRGDDDYRPGESHDVRIDRYLTADVWTDRADAEYYDGDNITIHFKVNRDAFVAIYSIDSRGQVDLIFPADPNDDNFVQGGVTYNLPDGKDNYDLVVNGPKGNENFQIVASRERFPIPNWYRNSGLVCDWDDRGEYMDDLNARYFVRYDGQRFAYDRAAIFVDEWEQDYFRPIYTPYYPGWAVCGNVYIDYPWGGAVYVNGIYWGCAPLYIPRLLVGWHTVSIYDSYGYCWENDVHVSRYNTLVLDRTIIKTRPGAMSKYKEVRAVGYRDPIKSGYPDYDKRVAVIKTKSVRTDAPTVGSYGAGKQRTAITQTDNFAPLPKKFVRGDAKVIQSDRGIETDGLGVRTRRDSDQRSNPNSFLDNKRDGAAPNSGTGSTYNGERRRTGSTTTIDNPSNGGTSSPTVRRREGSSGTQPATREPAVERRREGTSEGHKADHPAEQARPKQESKPANPPAVKEKAAPAPAPSGGGGEKSKGSSGGGGGHRRGGM